MQAEGEHLKGRGAQKHIANRFDKNHHETRDDFLNYCSLQGESIEKIPTSFIETFPKTIVNKVSSPDVGMLYSLNPYQGCEHGCVYCFARPTHAYLDLSPGLDFETKLVAKTNAPFLFEEELAHPK